MGNFNLEVVKGCKVCLPHMLKYFTRSLYEFMIKIRDNEINNIRVTRKSIGNFKYIYDYYLTNSNDVIIKVWQESDLADELVITNSKCLCCRRNLSNILYKTLSFDMIKCMSEDVMKVLKTKLLLTESSLIDDSILMGLLLKVKDTTELKQQLMIFVYNLKFFTGGVRYNLYIDSHKLDFILSKYFKELTFDIDKGKMFEILDLIHKSIGIHTKLCDKYSFMM